MRSVLPLVARGYIARTRTTLVYITCSKTFIFSILHQLVHCFWRKYDEKLSHTAIIYSAASITDREEMLLNIIVIKRHEVYEDFML